MRIAHLLAAATLAASITLATAAPVPAEFTYQGVLEVDGQPVQTDADFIIRLYDGSTLVTAISRDVVPVSDGQFTLDLNFDPAFFDGTAFDIEFLVRSPAGIGAYETLGTRQPLTTTPYAFHANTADSAANITAPASIDAIAPGVALTVTQADTTSDGKALRLTRGPATRLAGRFIDRVAEVESDEADIGILAISQSFPFAGILDGSSSTSNTAAILGEIEPDGNAAAFGLWGLNFASDTEARLATGQNGAEFFGDVRVDQGSFVQSYSSGTYDLATPIAYGFVNATGEVNAGTPNVSSVWNASLSRYEIEIDGESYFFNQYVTIVTPAFQNLSARASSANGRLLVYLESTINQNDTQASFQFITYKPNGAALVQGQRRAPLQPLASPLTDEDLYPNTPLAPRTFVNPDKTTLSPTARD